MTLCVFAPKELTAGSPDHTDAKDCQDWLTEGGVEAKKMGYVREIHDKK
jgi:hypothetical protein